MSVSMERNVLSREGPVQQRRGTPRPDHDKVALDTMDSPMMSPQKEMWCSDGYVGAKQNGKSVKLVLVPAHPFTRSRVIPDLASRVRE